MRHVIRLICLATLASFLMLAMQEKAQAQYPVYYAPAPPAVPAVVGYSARRGGLFGQRLVVRPVIAPVAAAPVVVARPVYGPSPIAVEYAPVSAYYPPPVAAYRVPVGRYVPIYGF
jgi:hypothetical protein